ncbi:hypothetical protein D3C81_443080 [compost metagenome]
MRTPAPCKVGNRAHPVSTGGTCTTTRTARAKRSEEAEVVSHCRVDVPPRSLTVEVLIADRGSDRHWISSFPERCSCRYSLTDLPRAEVGDPAWVIVLKHPFFSDVLQTTCFDHWTVRRVCSKPLDVQTFHDAVTVDHLIRRRWYCPGPVTHLNPIAAIGGHVAVRFEGRAIICVHVVDTVNTQDRVLDAACGGRHVPTIQIDLAVDVTHVVDVLVGEFRTFQEEP